MENNNKLNELKEVLKGTATKKGFLETYFGGKGSTGNGNYPASSLHESSDPIDELPQHIRP